MAVEYICDHCGKRAPAYFQSEPTNITENYLRHLKPVDPIWFSRVVDGVPEEACSKKCAEVLDKAKPSGFTGF